MDHKALFPVLEMGFSFLVTWWNIQIAMIADKAKNLLGLKGGKMKRGYALLILILIY